MKSGNILIQYYKRFINPVLPHRCKFTPSCSAYTAQAVKKYGALRGTAMGAVRILRCNPLSKGGYAPVKDDYKGKAKWLL